MKLETTYREWNHRDTGTHTLLDKDRRVSVTRVAVCMEVKEMGDVNREPGCIQSASKLGMSTS